MSKLQELLTDELRDLYDAEKQLTKALPKLAKAASSKELKQAFLEHTEMTKNQASRLEQVFELLGERAKSKPCKAMKGLVEEANEHLEEHERGHELDAVLVASAQRVEHYEIAGYGTARAYAKSLGNREAMALLEETLKEEALTDKLLTKIGLQVQKEVLHEEGEDERRARDQMSRYEQEARSIRGPRSQRRGSRSPASRNGGAGKQAAASNRSGSRATTDHDEIREWAEERGAHPACVRGSGGKGDAGMIRLDFPGYSGGDSLEEISWNEFFKKFDEQGLALLIQDRTKGGRKSNFNKLIARGAAAGGRGGRTASARQ